MARRPVAQRLGGEVDGEVGEEAADGAQRADDAADERRNGVQGGAERSARCGTLALLEILPLQHSGRG